ncbi:hypothetical protein E3Q22_02676 [Wallemia mellicola]|uniref:Uncharacterized protein n=1 Tax=Wallemia mellicola TaxID=1708541 RepID=A0A4T0R9B6_9BASI|nr:hypothetical protein E3Q24_02980 [Wallemia mellicola]TIB71751.1 hypothetical protein E3Q23_03661 [Wallemia mellicola]TIB78319.1 hypothetical protein E3Q22_02676 [Wallemia mellicola]TIB88400.1 hypothetical protein E3Q21_00960 [Wallemia mellicola]TIB91126.1 hypothetical protein E3Q20_00946 [Wallemia mellicola]
MEVDKVKISQRVINLLKNLSSKALSETAIDLIDDSKSPKPRGNITDLLEKYNIHRAKQTQKTQLTRELTADFEKPLLLEWKCYKLTNSKSPSIHEFTEVFINTLSVTQSFGLYQTFVPTSIIPSQSEYGIEGTTIFTLIFTSMQPETLPPSNHRIMFIPLLKAGKILMTSLNQSFKPFFDRALLNAFGHAEGLQYTNLRDTNVGALKSLTLDPKSQGIWKRLTNHCVNIPNPLEEAPDRIDEDPLIADHELKPPSLGEKYDGIIVQSEERNQEMLRRQREALDLWGDGDDLPQISSLSFNVQMPWKIKDEKGTLDCSLSFHGKNVYAGLRQWELEGKTTEAGLPGWLTQSMECGQTENLLVKTSRKSNKWTYVFEDEEDYDNIYGPLLDSDTEDEGTSQHKRRRDKDLEESRKKSKQIEDLQQEREQERIKSKYENPQRPIQSGRDDNIQRAYQIFARETPLKLKKAREEMQKQPRPPRRPSFRSSSE